MKRARNSSFDNLRKGKQLTDSEIAQTTIDELTTEVKEMKDKLLITKNELAATKNELKATKEELKATVTLWETKFIERTKLSEDRIISLQESQTLTLANLRQSELVKQELVRQLSKQDSIKNAKPKEVHPVVINGVEVRKPTPVNSTLGHWFYDRSHRHQVETRRNYTSRSLVHIHGSYRGAAAGAYDFWKSHSNLTEKIAATKATGLFQLAHLETRDMQKDKPKDTPSDELLRGLAFRFRERTAQDSLTRMHNLLFKNQEGSLNQVQNKEFGIDARSKRTIATNYQINQFMEQKVSVGLWKKFPENTGVLGYIKPVESAAQEILQFIYGNEHIYKSMYWFKGEENVIHLLRGFDTAPETKTKNMLLGIDSIMNGLGVLRSRDHSMLSCCGDGSEANKALMKIIGTDYKNLDPLRARNWTVTRYDGKKIDNVRLDFHFVSDQAALTKIMVSSTQSYHLPSDFADVTSEGLGKLGGSVGTSEENTWKEWDYGFLQDTGKKIEDFTAQAEKDNPIENFPDDPDRYKSTPKERRDDKIAKLILLEMDRLHTRQHGVPFLPQFLVDRLRAEPLHNEHNAWDQFLARCYMEANARGNGCVDRLTSALRSTPLNMTSVADVVCTHHSKNPNNALSYRLAGDQQTKLSEFFYLITNALTFPGETDRQKLTRASLRFSGLELRDAASLWNRILIDDPLISDQLENHCRSFNAAWVLFGGTPTPTTWTIGNIIPYHFRKTVAELGVGLGIYTMQGRESENAGVKIDLENSNMALESKEYVVPRGVGNDKWGQVILANYIRVIFLERHLPSSLGRIGHYKPRIPQRCTNGTYCWCGESPKVDGSDVCEACGDFFFRLVKQCVDALVLTPVAIKIWFPIACVSCPKRFQTSEELEFHCIHDHPTTPTLPISATASALAKTTLSNKPVKKMTPDELNQILLCHYTEEEVLNSGWGKKMKQNLVEDL
eukprot:Lithocolla_globosa_v1_NODE_685_length_3439_cov_15.378842.p1 type:complete len:954 gc:universal NODE_685_length_3439_cov_15.378842:530-3391(+)